MQNTCFISASIRTNQFDTAAIISIYAQEKKVLFIMKGDPLIPKVVTSGQSSAGQLGSIFLDAVTMSYLHGIAMTSH